MAKPSSAESRTTPPHKCKRQSKIPSFKSLFSKKPLTYLTITFTALIFALLQTLRPAPLNFTNRRGEENFTRELEKPVTFLPLKDLRYSGKPLVGHTWFMSSMLDTSEKGEVQYQEYPSKASKGRILCLKGRDAHDGSHNSYALVWPQALPPNMTLMKGLTFISYNHYDYGNIWHGLSAFVPFAAWHLKNKCTAKPARWVLYHWGELRFEMGPWLRSLAKATFGEPLKIERFDKKGDRPACFERVVVMRHNEGGMSRERRLQVYDFLRCKSRVFCNVSYRDSLSEADDPVIGMTMLMRTGSRSFRNQSVVAGIFQNACRRATGCHLVVAYAKYLNFCQQVKLMGSTDVLVSPHGAQLTNMFLMERNSSVMGFFPRGWLKLAGVGQYVFRWMASWSGMIHRGAWRDPGGGGGRCNFPEDDRRCMSVYKNVRIGHNESYFTEWAEKVLMDVRVRKAQGMWKKEKRIANSCGLLVVAN